MLLAEKPSIPRTKQNPIKRNNLICVKQILWYIRFTVDATTLCEAVFSNCGYEKRDVTWRIVLKVGLVLIVLGATGSVLCQNPNSEESNPILKSDLLGKRIFELKCATCHGLDGLGGEHAPDISRRTAVRTLSDQALLGLIHDGIPEDGMPAFPSMNKEDGQAVVAHLRFLQGKASVNSMSGDPVRGKDVFFGKAGCSTCHQIESRAQFVAGDLAGFARDHPADEIRDAILKPAGGQQESATAIARNGRKFSGMIRNEDNASLQLQDGDGRFYLLMKSSLVSVKRKAGDPMPADYARRLSTTDVDDLVGYILQAARAPGLPLSPSGKDKDEEPHDHD
jgi:cytochrome c oxidase cbb3-type subunit III